MALVCIPEVLTDLLTPILPYLTIRKGKCQMRHLCQKCQKCHIWRRCYLTHVQYRYGNMGVKRSVRTSGRQTIAIKHLLNLFNSLKCLNTDFQKFPLYFLKFPLYNIRGLSGPFPCSLRLETLHVILYMVEEWDKLCC